MKEERIKTVQKFFEKYDSPTISGLPKYAQLREAINSAINDGFWRPGEQLPNESMLANFKRYSLGTVQKAMRELSLQRKIVRKQGQGSFVSEANSAMSRPNHLRFVNDRENVSDIFPKIIGRYSVEQEGRWSDILGVDIKSILRIDRLFYINSELITYSRFYIDISKYCIFATWNTNSLQSENFKSLLRREYNINIIRYKQFLSVKSFDDVSIVFNSKLDLVGAVLEFTGISDQDSAIYYQKVFVPQNERRLNLSTEVVSS